MRMMWIFVLVCLGGAMVSASEESHRFSVHDMLAMERVSDAQVSPDGALIVFTVSTTDMEENKGSTDLWLVGSDGKGRRQLTSHRGG